MIRAVNLKEYNDLNKNSAFENPRLSIGVPVYNGEKYLEEALDSILAQTYTDFELIISDNASTDNTPRICHAYAERDRRIHYHRNERQLSATQNFIRVFKLSKGEFFKWAAHDDVLAPGFLSRCINVLEKDPSIILCHSNTGNINEHGKLIGIYNYTNKINSWKPHERFDALVRDRHNAWVLIFGVMRASILRSTQLLGNYVAADRVLLAELGLLGRMYKIPEYLFFRRSHPQAYTESMYHSGTRSSKEKLNWWTKAGRINFPNVKMLIEYFKSVRRASLKFTEHLLCYAQIVKWFLREGWMLVFFDVGINLLGGSRLGSMFQANARRIAKLLRTTRVG